MEYTHLSVLALFFLALVRIDASHSGEDYWHSVMPNTPLPKALSDLLLPYSSTNLPIKAEEEKQYWTVFFEHDLYPGKKMSLGFHKQYDIPPFQSRAWLPAKKASQPFGINIWWHPKVSQRFGIGPWHSKVTQPFEFDAWHGNTIGRERYSLAEFCGNSAPVGENKYCALSIESMMDFAISKLGMKIKVISSSFSQNQDQYMVEEVKRIGDKAVMCHRLNFKKVVFYCHQVNATTTYMVPLVASDGSKAKALTICHHDTRGMDPNVLYEVLKVRPGGVPVCHFVGNKAIAWVPNHVVGESNHHPCDV